MATTFMQGIKWWITPDINISISKLGKACQYYILIDGTLLLGISKCHPLRLKSCYHSSEYLLSTSMIVCSIQLVIISSIINPCWWTSFFRIISTHANVHDYVNLFESSTRVGVSSTIGLGVCTTSSPLFDKFVYHIPKLDIGKDIRIFIFHLIPFSLVHVVAFYILTSMQFYCSITALLNSFIHICLSKLINLVLSCNKICMWF